VRTHNIPTRLKSRTPNKNVFSEERVNPFQQKTVSVKKSRLYTRKLDFTHEN